MGICYLWEVMLVKQELTMPNFTIFTGGISTIPKWVVYGIVLTTVCYGKSPSLIGSHPYIYIYIHSYWNFIIPTVTHSIIFQRGRSTTNQIYTIYISPLNGWKTVYPLVMTWLHFAEAMAFKKKMLMSFPIETVVIFHSFL